MFFAIVEIPFHASHQLTLPDGSKEPLHCHNWLVTAQVSRRTLDQMGLVMDFNILGGLVKNIVTPFDNNTLDKIDYFKQKNPSAENVAMYIYEKLEQKLPKGVNLKEIKVVEQPGCSAKFSR